jgi:hypothetical protein
MANGVRISQTMNGYLNAWPMAGSPAPAIVIAFSEGNNKQSIPGFGASFPIPSNPGCAWNYVVDGSPTFHGLASTPRDSPNRSGFRTRPAATARGITTTARSSRPTKEVLMRLKSLYSLAAALLVLCAAGCSKNEAIDVPATDAPGGAAKADLGSTGAGGSGPGGAAPSGAAPTAQ